MTINTKSELNKRDYEAVIFALHFDGRTPIIERGFWNYDWKELERKCIEQSKRIGVKS